MHICELVQNFVDSVSVNITLENLLRFVENILVVMLVDQKCPNVLFFGTLWIEKLICNKGLRIWWLMIFQKLPHERE